MRLNDKARKKFHFKLLIRLKGSLLYSHDPSSTSFPHIRPSLRSLFTTVSLHVIYVVQFIWHDRIQSTTYLLVLLVGHLPNLQDVILSARCHHKPLVEVPGDVLDLGGVPTMDEDKLGRAISLFLFCLFGTATGQVPHHDATIGAA